MPGTAVGKEQAWLIFTARKMQDQHHFLYECWLYDAGCFHSVLITDLEQKWRARGLAIPDDAAFVADVYNEFLRSGLTSTTSTFPGIRFYGMY